ncbi:MAG TPA: class I SAM-dependent methyltransferase, partial [Clostridia bacterium]|nr:class I SAM-dependent methyltransferase [Clostridia bacterium]
KPGIPFMGERYTNDGNYIAQIDGLQARTRERIYNRLASGKIALEEVACPCGGKEFLLLSEKERFGLPVKIVMCKRCGIILQSPRMAQEGFDDFYSGDFSDLAFNINAVSPEDYFFWRKKDGPPVIHEYLKDILTADSHLLEIGCGAGGILDYFRQIGCKVTGIDLDENYISYGRSLGLDLYCCHTRDFISNESRKFDIVILAHVLEHFLDIEKELSDIKKLIMPGGYLYVELPGIKGFSLEYHQFDFLNSLQLAHTYYFDRDTFVQMMSWYGFRCVKSNEYISGLFQIDESVAKRRENHSADLLRFLTYLETHRKSLQKGVFAQETQMKEEAGNGNALGN